jgi:hypothetical protein
LTWGTCQQKRYSRKKQALVQEEGPMKEWTPEEKDQKEKKDEKVIVSLCFQDPPEEG